MPEPIWATGLWRATFPRAAGDGSAGATPWVVGDCGENTHSNAVARVEPAPPRGYAVFTAAAFSSPSSLMAVSRILYFCTLPVTVIGNSSTSFQ